MAVAFRIGRGNQAQFSVEDAEQVVEVGWAILIPGGGQQVGMRSHAAFDVGVQFRQQRSQDATCGNAVATETRISVYGRKRFLQKTYADSHSATDLLQRLRFPGLGFDHFRHQRQPNGDHFAILSQPAGNAGDKLIFIHRQVGGTCRQLPECLTEPDQEFPCVVDIEQIDKQEIPAGYHLDIQCLHQSQGGDIKVIADHENGLQSTTITLAQSFDQFSLRVGSMGMEPLFELVDDNHDFVALTASQCGQSICQAKIVRQFQQTLPETSQNSGFCVFGGRFHIHRDHAVRQMRQQAGFHQ